MIWFVEWIFKIFPLNNKNRLQYFYNFQLITAKNQLPTVKSQKPNYIKRFGQKSEQRAAEFLMKKGFKILARNFYAREGEIDLIARDGSEIVFVEVKARNNTKFGAAIEAVTEKKLTKIVITGEKWLEKNSLENSDWRVDVITIDSGKIEHFCGV